MAHIEVKGFKATIRRNEWLTDDITEDFLSELKDKFDGDEVDEETINNFLYRSAIDRQKIMKHFDIVKQLSAQEKDPLITKDIVKCLGNFPRYEKKFLLNVLSSTSSVETKFMFLAETLFSKTAEVLEDFREAEPSFNEKIISCMRDPPVYPNKNISDALEAVFKGATPNPFSQSSEMYELSDEQSELNLKHIYEQCREGYLGRRLFLKKLLLDADRTNNVSMVIKIILSHCDFDLHSILVELKGEETKQVSDPSLIQRIETLQSLESINNEHLRELVRTAAFGVDE